MGGQVRFQLGIYVAIQRYLLFFDGFALGNFLILIDSFSILVFKLPEFLKGTVLRILAKLEAYIRLNGHH